MFDHDPENSEGKTKKKEKKKRNKGWNNQCHTICLHTMLETSRKQNQISINKLIKQESFIRPSSPLH